MVPAADEVPVVLTIAGTDPSGGAGIGVDLQVFRDFGCYGTSAITAIVRQNTRGVDGWRAVDRPELRGQIEAVWRDFEIGAIKIGMIPSARLMREVRDFLEGADRTVPVVYDPVMAAGADGYELMTAGGRKALAAFAEVVDLLTPNADEATRLVGGNESSPREQIETLLGSGWNRVLLKGGHLRQTPDDPVVDWYGTVDEIVELRGLTPVAADVRGTGCQLSSAIAAGRARGMDWRTAIEEARSYLNERLIEDVRSPGRGRPVVVRVESRGRDGT